MIKDVDVNLNEPLLIECDPNRKAVINKDETQCATCCYQQLIKTY